MINHSCIIVENLKKYYGDIKAVDDISFNVRFGEVFGLLGPNGAGKTTTIKTILGLIEATEGKINILGIDLKANRVLIKKRVGYVAEDPLIYRYLTVKELFNFIASIRKLKGKEFTEDLRYYIESLNLEKEYSQIIDTLSHGNKQKVQLIAAILHKPDLLILDEPFSGLDSKSIKIVKEILKIQIEKGISIIFSTHILGYAQDLCDRICIINKGKIAGIGTFKELQEKIKDKKTNLEDIFLKLTEEEKKINETIKNWKKDHKRN
ncbi:MAG: ABC transporter ATP-binding protein [Candidatus Lokiarchaeota archaeon]